MSIISAALLVGAGVVSVAAYRTRKDRFWLVLGATFAVGLVLSLLRNGLNASVSVDIGDGLIFVVGLFAAAEAFGLPRGLAVRIGIGLRSREWEFDRKLADLLGPLDLLLEGHPPGIGEEASRDRDNAPIEDGRARLEALARMKPPDDDWRALTSKYATIYAAHLDAARRNPPSAVPPSIVQLAEEAAMELERLRVLYRADADRLYRSSLAVRLLHKRRD
jgi:hypothetical protein